jgi:hypothetical protein
MMMIGAGSLFQTMRFIMRHRFEHVYDGGFNVPATRVLVETDAEALDDVIEAFEDYLRGCGYIFTEHIGLVEKEK